MPGLLDTIMFAGSDPFNNVELVAGREIGWETVTYVSNIYKYYIAYKLAVERASAKKKRGAVPKLQTSREFHVDPVAGNRLS
jgi:hypothetical protein